MAKENRTVEVMKEVDDVMLLIVNVVKAAKAKKSIAEIAASELQDLVNAMAGIDQIPVEFQDKEASLRTVGMRVGELSAALI